MKIQFLVLSFIFLIACKSAEEKKDTIPPPSHIIEGIGFDPETDDPTFRLCQEGKFAIQYFNGRTGLQYEGEKSAIVEAFRSRYDASQVKKESGLIRIHFVVNCEGKTDRFRMISSDESYEEKTFDPKITSQVMAITQSLDGWKVKELRGQKVDYYQYLLFNIQKGNIRKILP